MVPSPSSDIDDTSRNRLEVSRTDRRSQALATGDRRRPLQTFE